MDPMVLMPGLLLGSIAIGTAGAILAWRERPEPGSVPLTALLVTQCWWSATLFFRLEMADVAAKVFWLEISWLGVAFIPVAWLFFSLEYAGYSQYIRPRYLVPVLIIPIITAILAVTSTHHDFMYVSMELVEVNGRMQLVRTFGPWYWIIASYTYVLGFLGSIPLLEFISSELNTFRGQGAAILIGLLAPWVTNILFLLGVLPTGSIDPTPVAFSVSGIAYLGALTRFDLFGMSPTPIRPARQSTFERMRDGVIILDRFDHIVDMNEQAVQILDTDTNELLGRPIETVIPEFEGIGSGSGQSGQVVFRPEQTNRAYDINRSHVDDSHGRIVGQLVTLHDISDHLRQQQRLEVVNRVYRHNIRTSIQIILGNVESLEIEGNQRKVAAVREEALEITEYTEKIRTILDVFERGRTSHETIQLDTAIERSVEAIRSKYPDVDIQQNEQIGSVNLGALLEDVLWHALENAAKHNTNEEPQIRVDATQTDGRVKITIADNGPGIDGEELTLLREGTETPLRHGSGIGLAIIIWGTEMMGGKIAVDENEPTGTVLTISVPADLSPSAVHR